MPFLYYYTFIDRSGPEVGRRLAALEGELPELFRQAFADAAGLADGIEAQVVVERVVDGDGDATISAIWRSPTPGVVPSLDADLICHPVSDGTSQLAFRGVYRSRGGWGEELHREAERGVKALVDGLAHRLEEEVEDVRR